MKIDHVATATTTLAMSCRETTKRDDNTSDVAATATHTPSKGVNCRARVARVETVGGSKSAPPPHRSPRRNGNPFPLESR